MKYKYLPHTSEAKFQSYGKTLDEAFENAALALFNMMIDIKTVKPKFPIKIKIISEKLESLLFDFVDELIFTQDTKSFLLSKVKSLTINKKNEKYELKSELIGDKVTNYETHGHIKAPTYSDMFIRKGKNRYTIQMVVDV